MATAGVDPATLAYHEIRAPIGLIATAARFAAEDCTDPVTRARVEAIADTAEEVLTALKVVLTEAAAAGRATYHPSSLVRRFAETRALLGWNIRVYADINPECEGDGAAMESLLHCIFNNCLDHADPSHPTIMHVIEDGDSIVVMVENASRSDAGHAGSGLGRRVAAQLAARAGAELDYAIVGDRHSVAVRVPAITSAVSRECPTELRYLSETNR